MSIPQQDPPAASRGVDWTELVMAQRRVLTAQRREQRNRYMLSISGENQICSHPGVTLPSEREEIPTSEKVSIVSPREHDVLCGRDRAVCYYFPGNIAFRGLVDERRKFYNECGTDEQRARVVRGVVDEICGSTPPGRFLDMDSETGLWVELDDAGAVYKACEALNASKPKPPQRSATSAPAAAATSPSSTTTGKGRKPNLKVKKRRGITKPNRNDVLCGRGELIANHSGNVAYRRFASERKADYRRCMLPKEKAKVVMEVIKFVTSRNPPGRFLVWNEGTECWVPISHAKAKFKTGQCLREGNRLTIYPTGAKGSVEVEAQGSQCSSHQHRSFAEGGSTSSSSANSTGSSPNTKLSPQRTSGDKPAETTAEKNGNNSIELGHRVMLWKSQDDANSIPTSVFLSNALNLTKGVDTAAAGLDTSMAKSGNNERGQKAPTPHQHIKCLSDDDDNDDDTPSSSPPPPSPPPLTKVSKKSLACGPSSSLSRINALDKKMRSLEEVVVQQTLPGPVLPFQFVGISGQQQTAQSRQQISSSQFAHSRGSTESGLVNDAAGVNAAPPIIPASSECAPGKGTAGKKRKVEGLNVGDRSCPPRQSAAGGQVPRAEDWPKSRETNQCRGVPSSSRGAPRSVQVEAYEEGTFSSSSPSSPSTAKSALVRQGSPTEDPPSDEQQLQGLERRVDSFGRDVETLKQEIDAIRDLLLHISGPYFEGFRAAAK